MSHKALQNLLEQDLSGAQQLDNLLLEERRLLERRDVQNLDGLLGRKAELLASMERNDQARRQLIQECGFEPGRGGLQACCQHLDARQNGRTLENLFEALQNALERCREATTVNANIVHRSRSHNARLINLLRGGEAQPDLYSPGGTEGPRPGNRPLGSA